MSDEKKVPWGKIDPQHIIKACTCNKGNCPICDWGLAVCAVCGKAEAELIETCEKKICI